MPADIELNVATLDRDGVRLAHIEAGPKAPKGPPIVFIHGWMGDHQALLPQITHYAEKHRVVAIHLRGHGDSDAPEQDYDMAGFADDVAWQCRQLRIGKPLIVGHSLGGSITLEIAGRHPDLPVGIVMIDSIVSPPSQFTEAAGKMVEEFNGPDFRAAARRQAIEIYLDHVDIDDPKRKERLLAPVFEAHLKTTQQAAVSTISNVIRGYDPMIAARACKVPVLYIDAGVPMVEQARDMEAFRAACPTLVVAKTYGAGHFSQLEVPDQVNGMIDRFIAVGIDRRPS